MLRKSSYLSVFISWLILLFFFSCSPKISNKIVHNKTKNVIIDSLPNTIISDTVKKVNLVEKHIIEPGDKQFHKYLPLLAGKNVALAANQTSVIDSVHLLDFLLSRNINVVKIFALEHGFRGTVDRGEHFSAETDKKTGIPIIAVYGKNRKPKAEQLADIDIVIFDIQDVGVRFYTYISS
ncbi:MAG: DUF1343 domain-containing protein, partial [Bacteroidetes bacterium]